jgi:hypothetical protein
LWKTVKKRGILTLLTSLMVSLIDWLHVCDKSFNACWQYLQNVFPCQSAKISSKVRHLWYHWLIDSMHMIHHSTRINKTYKNWTHVKTLKCHQNWENCEKLNPLKCHQNWENCEKLKKPIKIVTFWWRMSRFCDAA